MAKEFLVAFVIGYVVLAYCGTADSAWDFCVEKLLGGPLALALMLVFHFLLSWGRAPRAIYIQLQEDLQNLRKHAVQPAQPDTVPTLDSLTAVKSQILTAANDKFSPQWRIETRNILKGALGGRYAREFERSLWNNDPERAGKKYLEGLAARLDGKLLWKSRLEREGESHHLASAFDMIQELMDGEPPLRGRITQAARQSVIEWREKCTTTLQERLSDEHRGAWEKVFATLGFVSTQSSDEVKSAVKEAAIHLRVIYSKLDETMLSKTFPLTNGQHGAIGPADQD